MDLKTVRQLEKIATAIVDSAIKIHRALGPGLLEAAYESCVADEKGIRRMVLGL